MDNWRILEIVEPLLLLACALLMLDQVRSAMSNTWGVLRKRFPVLSKWAASRWGWIPPLVAATIAEGFHEYCVAWIFIVTSASVLTAVVIHWPGVEDSPKLTRVAKLAGVMGAIALAFVGTLWIWGDKGDQSCSRFPGFVARVIRGTKDDIPTPSLATVEIGLTLGADKGIGKDAIVDCKNPLYSCLEESEIRGKTLILDVGPKRWARLIFEIKNTSHVKVPPGSLTHIESRDAISLEYAPFPSPQRRTRNILDVPGSYDLQPFEIAKGNYAVPVDVVVPAPIKRFSLDVKVFGDNLPAHELHLSFLVNTKP